MYSANTIYGNCVDCAQYSRLNKDDLCPLCAVRETEILWTVQAYLKSHRNATRDEIAEKLQVDVRRLENWIRQGKLRCVVLQNLCPTCKRPIVNGFTCSHCRYTEKKALERRVQEKETSSASPFRVNVLHERGRERFERSRRRG